MWGQIFNKKLASWNLQKGENYIILGKSQGKEQKCQPSLTVNLGVLETSKITLVLFGYKNIISSLFGQRNIIMMIFGQSDSGTEWKSSGNLFTHHVVPILLFFIALNLLGEPTWSFHRSQPCNLSKFDLFDGDWRTHWSEFISANVSAQGHNLFIFDIWQAGEGYTTYKYIIQGRTLIRASGQYLVILLIFLRYDLVLFFTHT